MKKLSLALGILTLFTFMTEGCGEKGSKTDSSAQCDTLVLEKGSIVYFQLDKVLEEYEFAVKLRDEVETKVAAKQKEIDRRQKNLENKAKDFEYKVKNGLITSVVAEKTNASLQQQAADFQQYAQKEQGAILEEQQVMMNRIAEAIKNFIDAYNIEKGYAMIIANQANMPVVTGDSRLDITNEIIAGLNNEYAKNKNKED